MTTTNDGMSRRSLWLRSLLGAATAGAMASEGNAQLVYGTKNWDLSAFDAIVKKPARVKQVYDITSIGDGRFLNNIKNSLNGLHFGFGIRAEDIQVVAALHGPANLLNYDDYVWQKYKIGEWLKVEDPKTGKPALRNLFYPSAAGKDLQYSSADPNDDASAYQDTSIQGLQSRGVRFLSCHTATEEQARALVKRLNTGETREQVVSDLQAHTVPHVLIVASMVAAVALLQTEGHYSYITV